MLLELSARINSERDLRTLATALKVKGHIIDRHLHNEKDINEAAFKVLQEWRNRLENPHIAYRILCEALRSVDMAKYISEVLEAPRD